ncbi:Levodione reductase [Colletotrichum fructicola]|nr:Levodione reductase [Colletotrichum fructicola]
MTSSFADRVIVIAGSASGMGLATSKTLISKGAKVAMCDLNGKSLENFRNDLDPEIQRRVLVKSVDVISRQGVKSFLAETMAHFGKIDGVANFAGTGGHELGTQSIWETSDEEFQFIVDLNIKGAFNFLAESLKPGVLTDGGSFVHVGRMVRSAAKEVGGRARVNCVLPGAIDTPMHRANLERVQDFPAPTLVGDAQEVADVTVFLLSDKSTFVNGAAWSVDGGAGL